MISIAKPSFTSIVRAVTIFAASLTFAGAASAGLFDDDEARKAVNELRARVIANERSNEGKLGQLDEQIKALNIVELVRQIEQLREEVARLRGQIEVLTNNDDQINKRQRDFYQDIDSRLKRLETAAQAQAQNGATSGSTPVGTPPGTPPGPPPTAATPTPPPAITATSPNAVPPAPPVGTRPPAPQQAQAELKSYDVGQGLFKRNDFVGAVNAFVAFIREFPGSSLVPNAYYWLGISHANLKDNRNAMAAQDTVVRRYADSTKAPDAMLAMASMQSEQGDANASRDTLESLINRYPQSEAAAKARQRLGRR
jgi:tol-pal system protein YbgF